MKNIFGHIAKEIKAIDEGRRTVVFNNGAYAVSGGAHIVSIPPVSRKPHSGNYASRFRAFAPCIKPEFVDGDMMAQYVFGLGEAASVAEWTRSRKDDFMSSIYSAILKTYVTRTRFGTRTKTTPKINCSDSIIASMHAHGCVCRM